MLKIDKLPAPQGLTAYRAERGGKATYKGFKGWWKKEDSNRPYNLLRKQLLQEQGFVCAYCGQKLPDEPETSIGKQSMGVEHFIPQQGRHGNANQALEFENLLGCCLGGGDKVGENHCNPRKGDQLFLHIKNPAIDTEWAETVKYLVNEESEEVSMYSTNQDVQGEMDELLNLNAEALKQLRFLAFRDLKRRSGIHTNPAREIIESLCTPLQSRSPNSRREAFEHFLRWYLEDWLARNPS